MSAPAPRAYARSAAFAIGGRVRTAAIAVVVGMAGCSGSVERPMQELVRQDGVTLDPVTMEPFSGLAFVTFDQQPPRAHRRLAGTGTVGALVERSGRRLSMRESYQNGVKHGPYEWFFENGQLFEAGTYAQGRRDGPYRAYWENGDLYEEGTYRRGEFDGPRRWYTNGRLVELVTYDMGVVDGLYERYRGDGTLDLKGMLDDGQPCGIWFEGRRTIAYDPCGGHAAE